MTPNRDADITALCTRYQLPELGADLIRQNATIEQARAAVLNELARRDLEAGGHMNVTSSLLSRGADREAALIVETLVQRMGGRPQGETIRSVDCTGLAVRALQAAGYRVSDSDSRDRIFERAFAIRGAMHTTSDFPSLLGLAVGRVLHDAYTAAPPALKTIARPANLPDFRSRSVVRLGGAPSLEVVSEAGEFKMGTVVEAANGWRLATYGRIIALSRQALVNDDLGGFADLLRKFGEAASRREADELVGVLIDPPAIDGAALFHADRSTLITGAGSALSATSLADAVKSLRAQRDLDGGLVLQEPATLVVPAALEMTARQLTATINPAATSAVQPFGLSVVVEPRLDATSMTAWYLVAGSQAALEYGYLDGAEGPQITQQEGFEVDGLQIKARLDFGCGWVSPVGWVKATGVA